MGRVPAKIYRIKLTIAERKSLELIRDKGSHRSQAYKRAMILLLSDENNNSPCKTDEGISEILGVSHRTVERLRVRCSEVGALESLKSKPYPPRTDLLKVTGKLEASITQIACSEAPDGKTLPLATRPGSHRKTDYEYVREGSASAYMMA